MSQTLQSVLCITTNKNLVHVLVVLLHARFSVVGPIPFLLATIFFPVHPYIGSTTVLPDRDHASDQSDCIIELSYSLTAAGLTLYVHVCLSKLLYMYSWTQYEMKRHQQNNLT